MIIDGIRGIKSGRKELRDFGITLGAVFGLFGALLFWRDRSSYITFVSLCAAFLVCGVLFPTILKPLQKTWMAFSLLLGWFMTRIILVLLFYLVITPLGVIRRLLGKDSLNRKLNRQCDTYWIEKEQVTRNNKSYENQF
jgi:multisubunit Na+/H+ antiporter MnhG subunit